MVPILIRRLDLRVQDILKMRHLLLTCLDRPVIQAIIYGLPFAKKHSMIDGPIGLTVLDLHHSSKITRSRVSQIQ